MCQQCWEDDHGMPPTYSAWLGVYVDPLHLLASARTHNAISDALHVLRLVAVRSGAMRTQRQELSGIFALPLELLQEIESRLFDVAYIDFHPCRAILDDHAGTSVPPCSRCTKKAIAQRKTKAPVDTRAHNCSRVRQCALCSARKAEGLHGISSELIEAHCAVERSEFGIFHYSDDCEGCDGCGSTCSRTEVRGLMRLAHFEFLSGHKAKPEWKDISKALSTWALSIVSTPYSHYDDETEPDPPCHFGIGQLAAWGVGVGLKHGKTRSHSSEFTASATAVFDVEVSLEAQHAIADACAAMARGLRLPLRADPRGSAGPSKFPFVEDDRETTALTLDLPVPSPARDGKVLFNGPPPPVRAAVHFEAERDLSMYA